LERTVGPAGAETDAPPLKPAVKEPKAVRPAAPATASAEPVDYPTFVQRGDMHFFQGEYEKALRFYSRALQMESTRQYPWIGQIYCLLQLRQLSEADLWIQRALELFPDDPALLSLRAVVLARKGMTKRAIGTSDYAMTRGSSPFCWLARGEVLLLAENANAPLCFEKAMESIEPDDWFMPFRVGLVYFEQGLWSSALEYFQKTAARHAANFWLWYHLGLCYLRLAFQQEAIDAFRQSIALNPAFPRSHEALRRATRSGPLARLFGLFRRLG
jgi:tetratricopeptide (TPR) repeat protein